MESYESMVAFLELWTVLVFGTVPDRVERLAHPGRLDVWHPPTGVSLKYQRVVLLRTSISISELTDKLSSGKMIY